MLLVFDCTEKIFIDLGFLLCQETARCALQASSGSSVWGEQCHVQTSPWSLAGTAHQAASVHTGLSNRWVGWPNTDTHIVTTTILLMALHICRMVCVCGSLTVAVIWMENSTNQETLYPQTATTGEWNWLYSTIALQATMSLTLTFDLTCVCLYFSTCEAGRLVNCSQVSCNGRQKVIKCIFNRDTVALFYAFFSLLSYHSLTRFFILYRLNKSNSSLHAYNLSCKSCLH